MAMTTDKENRTPKIKRFKATNLHLALSDETIQGLKQGKVNAIEVARDLALQKEADDTPEGTFSDQECITWWRFAATGFARMTFGVTSPLERVQDECCHCGTRLPQVK